MKFFKNYRHLAAGITAVLATLLSIIIGCTILCYQWSSSIDVALGVDTSSSFEGAEITSDDIYYKSEFGDITALYKSSSDRTSEEEATLDKAQQALVAAEKEYAAREAEEGDVLLKNDAPTSQSDPALPLSSGMNVTLFGRAAGNPVYRSTSGGSKSYNTSSVISLADALATDGVTVNPTVQAALESATSTRNISSTNGEANIGELPTSTYSGLSYTGYTDAAIIVLSRVGGEGNDLNTSDADGVSQLALHQSEIELISMVKNANFDRVIVLINSGFPMELGDLMSGGSSEVDAVLWIGEPGTYGFQGVANVLTGKDGANPSGRLVDTYATNSLSSPAVQNFGNVSFTNNVSYKYIVEAEGIYTGYKYYETRYEDSILNSSSNASTATPDTNETYNKGRTWSYASEVIFPFGYGLSYTTFTQNIKEVTYDETSDTYTVTVTVTNTGDVAGKCSVEVYAQIPYDTTDSNAPETESIRLVGFNKTLGTLSDGETKESADYDLTDLESGYLQPNESEDVEVTVDRYLLTVYDETARNNKGGYILPAGDYYFAVGSDIHNALNNIIYAKDSTATGLVEADNTPYSQAKDAENNVLTQTYKLNNIGSELDDSTYAVSPYTGEDVSNQLTTQDVNYWQKDAVTYLTRSDWSTFPEKVSLSLTDSMKNEMDGNIYTTSSDAPKKGTYNQGEKNGIDFIEMKDVPYTGSYTDADGNVKDADEQWTLFLNQLSTDELIANTSDDANAVTSVNSPKAARQDGPDGINANLSNGLSSTCYNSEIVLSSTFSPKMLEMRGAFMGEDCLWTKYSVMWSPGCDIHRTPFSGRNFEYYSECGYMSYLCGSYEIPAMTAKGVISAQKHFVGNDQETNRQGVATFNTEQGWRQTSLKGFEGAIGKGQSLGVMTSYNCVGCTPSASCGATNVAIMQTEWGFKGHNVTDASFSQSYIESVSAVTNGTCVFCMDNRESDLKKAISRDSTDEILAAVRQANKQFYYSLLRTNAVNGVVAGATVVSATSWWKTALISVIVIVSVLTALSLAWYVTNEVFGILGKKKDEGGNE